jgi:putative PIN family toxin of toxin-antitoxin system
MNVVLDANIFVSAHIWGGNPDAVLDRIAEELDTLFISEDIVGELKNVFGKPKFALSKERIDGIIADIEQYGRKIAVSAKRRAIGVCRDPKDDKYIECALVAKADYIISGDIHLLELKEYCGVKIVTAREYLEIVNA